MNRRGFLRSALSVAVGAALAPIVGRALPDATPIPEVLPPVEPVIPYWREINIDQWAGTRMLGIRKPQFYGLDRGNEDFGIIVHCD